LLVIGEVLSLLGAVARSWFVPRWRLQAEILLLRHQLNVLQRSVIRRPHLTGGDRLLFVWLYRLWPGVLRSLTLLRPETVVRWHRAGFRTYWRWKSQGRAGRPTIGKDVRDLIREISRANPLWGAPRVHGELLKLGIEVAQSTVSKYMGKGRRPPSQSWRTFLRNHADGIASADLFVVPTIMFRLLYGFIVLRHRRREIVSFGVTAYPTAEWLARQICEAFPWDTAPRNLVRDRDRSYGEPFKRRIRSMGIRDRPTAPRSPWQNPYVERLIGSIRRECLDHLIVFNEAHLRRAVASYVRYYHGIRTHLALEKDAPFGRAIQRVGRIIRVPQVGGLHWAFTRI
jgi:transposase InsO family protein